MAGAVLFTRDPMVNNRFAKPFVPYRWAEEETASAPTSVPVRRDQRRPHGGASHR